MSEVTRYFTSDTLPSCPATRKLYSCATDYVLASDYDTALSQLAALREELASANADKEAYAQNAIDLRERTDRLSASLSCAQGHVLAFKLSRQRLLARARARELEISGLQQRLADAERRNAELESELAESERKRREFVDAVKVETDQLELRISQSAVVPEGYAVVPIKPNKAMRDACRIAGKLPVWDDMMAAALTKPEEAKS